MIPVATGSNRVVLLCLQKKAILTTIGVLEEPLGNARLHGARLVAALLHTNTPSINQELCRLNTMGLLLVSGPTASLHLPCVFGPRWVGRRGPGHQEGTPGWHPERKLWFGPRTGAVCTEGPFPAPGRDPRGAGEAH